MMVLQLLWVLLVMPETKGVSLSKSNANSVSNNGGPSTGGRPKTGSRFPPDGDSAMQSVFRFCRFSDNA
jgi:hypothetical protein